MYLKNGFLDQEEILKTAKENNCAFIIEIGARQVGKTYGTLQLMLKMKERFILMRRTQTETDFITNGAVNPFYPIDNNIYIKKETKYTGGIYNANDENIGITMALSTVAKIRGFSGADYKYLVYDEFIPESHVMKIKNEADAFLNAIITINGNREIQDKPPLMTFLLANSNNLGSPILAGLNIIDKIEEMMNKGQEYSILRDRGIMIILPKSNELMKEKKKDSIIKAIGNDSKFVSMAYGNEFAYNDNENVATQPINEFNLKFSVRGQFAVYKHKSKDILYVTDFKRCANIIEDNERTKSLLLKVAPSIKAYFIQGRIYFTSLRIKEVFKSYIMS